MDFFQILPPISLTSGPPKGRPEAKDVVPLHRGRGDTDAPRTIAQPRIISVSSGKGGVGKTVISANLGLRLAELGRKVLLIDADLALANLDLMLGLKANRTVREVMAERCSLAEAMVRGPNGLTLLPACSGDESFAEMDGTRRMVLFNLIDSLEEEFDTVIVDTGAGIGSNAAGFAAAAQQALVVVTPDPASMADAYAMIKVLSNRGKKRINLVVNMATNPAEAESVVVRLLDLVDQFLDVAVVPVGYIYRDEVVLRSVRACTPVLRAYPRSGVSNAIAALADRLLLEPIETDSGAPTLFWKRLMGIGEGS